MRTQLLHGVGRRHNRFPFPLLGVFLLAGLLAGCGGGAKSIRLTVTTQDPNNCGGNPQVVWVRLFQLKDDQAFRAAPFQDLWAEDARVVANDLASTGAPDKETIDPRSPRDIHVVLAKETRYLGIVGNFCSLDTESNCWKASLPVKPDEDATFRLQVVGTCLDLARAGH